jgi:Xaa-Pro dipeptidase
VDTNYADTSPTLGALYSAHIETLTTRYDHALEQTGASHAVIFSGNPRVSFLDDYEMPFRPNPHFVAWLPLVHLPFSYIVYAQGEKPLLVYYQPRDYWHVVPGAPSGYWTDHFDIRIVHSLQDIAAHLPVDREKCILIGEIIDAATAFDIERVNPTKAVNILHYARGEKTEYEIAAMRAASRRGAKGHLAAETAFRNGSSEFDIHRAYCKAVSHTDSELPYGNIVALNQHGAVLHYTAMDREPPVEMLSLLIDAGAQIHGYASDITRSYSHGDQQFQALIDGMEVMQKEIVSENRV